MRIFSMCAFGVGGTLARYGMQGFVQNQTGTSFPYGTLTVNLAGCFFLGIVGQYALNYVAIPPDWRIGITTGFLEPIPRFLPSNGDRSYAQDSEWTKAAIYAIVSLIARVLLILAGMYLGDALS